MSQIVEAQLIEEQSPEAVATASPIRTRKTLKDHKIFVDNANAVKLRLKIGADPNLKNSAGHTPIMNAMKMKYQHKVEIIKHLLADERTDINLTDTEKNTALHMACGNYGGRDPNIVKLLLEHKNIDVNLLSKYGSNALSIAAGHGDEENVKLLLAKDEIDINIKNKNGNTALHLAARLDKTDAIKLLVQDERADVLVMNKKGYTVLDLITDVEVLKLIKIPDKQFNTHKDLKLFTSNVEIVRIRLKLGGDPNSMNLNGQTPLMYAAINACHIEIVKYLLADDRIDVNLADSKGFTVIHHAVMQDRVKMAQILMDDKRCDIYLLTKDDKSVLDLTENESILEILADG